MLGLHQFGSSESPEAFIKRQGDFAGLWRVTAQCNLRGMDQSNDFFVQELAGSKNAEMLKLVDAEGEGPSFEVTEASALLLRKQVAEEEWIEVMVSCMLHLLCLPSS